MSSQEMVRLEIEGAKIKIPQHVVVQNFLDSLNRQVVVLPALQSLTVAPRIGDVWPGQGGINGGHMRGMNGNRDYYLIVPTHKDAFIKEVTWGGRGEDETGAQCEYDGYKNTIALCDSKHDHPAAQWALSRVIDGFSDFYLPARRECRVIQANVPELFETGYHWTSTQYGSHFAWLQHFAIGLQNDSAKDDEFAARAVRRLFI